MKHHIIRNHFVLSTLVLGCFIGCDQKKSEPNSPSTPSNKVSIDDVKRDAKASMNTAAAFSQQERDKLHTTMKAEMAIMDAKIDSLRLKGKDLAKEAKENWEKKMTALDEKRKLTNERIAAISSSTSKAWSDVENGAKSAWDELSRAVQDATNEF